MTFNFSFCNFIFGVLLENKTLLEVSNKVNVLNTRFKTYDVRFGDIIPILLTDNGGELAIIWAFINDLEGNFGTDLFFYVPYQSLQKARIYKHHTLLCNIVPKDESFDEFDQAIVNIHSFYILYIHYLEILSLIFSYTRGFYKSYSSK